MYKSWFGLVFAAMLVNPASAQDHQKNVVECLKELGLHPVHGEFVITLRLASGRAGACRRDGPITTAFCGAAAGSSPASRIRLAFRDFFSH